MNNKMIIGIVVVLIVIVGVGMLMMGGNKPATQAGANSNTTQNAEPTMKSEMTTSKTIVDVANEAGNFKTLVAALKAAGLDSTLAGEGPFTVFAPTDEAFAKLPAGSVEALLADKDKLTKILTYHVVPGKVMAADVVKVPSAKTVNGQEVMVKVEGDKVMVDNSTVVKTDIPASNGVIHVIDTVLMPK